MKQCTGCGKRYDEAQPACPSCWSRTWVVAPAGNAPAELPADPYPCPECGYYASAGMRTCPHCKKKLRPQLLEWISVLGQLGSILAIIFSLIFFIHKHHNYWLIADLVLWIITGLAFGELKRGTYRGYQMMRAVLIGGPVLLLMMTIAATLLRQPWVMVDLSSMLIVRLFGGVLVYLLLMHQSIQDYCIIGKPKEQYVAKGIFLEQTHVTKAERMGSTITRNL